MSDGNPRYDICARGVYLFLILSILAGMFSLPALRGARGGDKKSSEPWTAAQEMRPAELASALSETKTSAPPTIIYAGFHTLFAGGHIPGATFHGTASTQTGLAELKKWAESLLRSTSVVIYCGCCPFDHCPNIRPAFLALHEMGFTNLRVLVMPTNFATDWADKGYPIQKGASPGTDVISDSRKTSRASDAGTF
jgi:thiosulfate/3-mercaptopyruvate sulfurtransferase